MDSFFTELKRRNVFKVGIAYAIVAWILMQVVDTFFPALNLPTWTVTLVAALLLIGFPIAILLAWAFELTPEGVKPTSTVGTDKSITHITSRKLDFIIIGVLVLALAFVVIDQYLLEENNTELSMPVAEEIAPVVEIVEEVTAPDVQESQREVLPNSVAVLLCDNLSPNPDDAYFAASIHEEILNQLVKIRALNVIARTSVLQYADAPPSISQIAEELNVGAVMECSVRFAGSAIMVTAQLIDPENNSHLWSETYPGDLSDLSTVFAMQADIAMNIANAVGAEFSVEEQANIKKIPTGSPAAYALYLKALTHVRTAFSGARTAMWEAELDQAIVHDPNFALAYAAKALFNAFYGFDEWPAEIERTVLESAAKALQLDPTLGWAHTALAYLYHSKWQINEARQSFDRALELDPNDSRILTAYSRFLRNVGDYTEGVRLARRAAELDPSNSFDRYQLGITLRYARDYEAAYEAFQAVLSVNAAAFNTHMQIGFTEITRGNHDEALRELELAEQLYAGGNEAFRFAQFAFGYSQLGRSQDVLRFIDQLTELDRKKPVDDGIWAMAHIAMREYDQAYARLEMAIEEQTRNVFTLAEIKANAYQDPVLDEPRFQALRNRISATQ
jgi:TolB-like protein/Flp pilus assembly protein TadD